MSFKFFGFHTKLKWNTSKPKKHKESSKNEVVCLRYTFNQNAYDYGIVENAQFLNPSTYNGSAPQIRPPSERSKPQIAPQLVKLPPPKAHRNAPDIPPPIKARTDVKPNYHREQSEDVEYIEVINSKKEEIPDKDLNGTVPIAGQTKKQDNIYLKNTTLPNQNANITNGTAHSVQPLQQREIESHTDGNLTFNLLEPREVKRKQEVVDYHEDGNWNLSVVPKAQEQRTVVQPLGIQLQDMEEETNEWSSEEEEDEEEEEEVPMPMKTLTVGGSSLSSQAASIFFGSSDERPQPTPRKVNFYGRSSASSEGSEASA